MKNESGRNSPWKLWLPVLGGLWCLLFWIYFLGFELPNSGWPRLDICFLLPSFLMENFSPQPLPDAPGGWQFLPERFTVFAAGLFILASAGAAGRLALRCLKILPQIDVPTMLAFSLGLGMSLISMATLGLGLSGCLVRTVFITLFLGLIAGEGILAIRELKKQRASVSRSARPAPGKHKDIPSSKEIDEISGHWKLILLLIMACFLGPMILGGTQPEMDFDVKEYHLEGPKEYFQNGRISFLPHNIYTSFPFLTEMLTLAGMVVHGDWYHGALAGKLVLVAFAPVAALGVFCLTRLIAGTRAAWLAVLFYLSTPWVYRIAIIAYTEGAMCCYAILTLLALFHWYDRSLSRMSGSPSSPQGAFPGGDRLLVGLLAGSAAATKYPGLVFITIPAGMALLCLDWQARKSIHSTLFSASVFAAGVLITFGPWLAKNLYETGNPVYPLAYTIFGGVDLDDDLHAKWSRGHAPPPDRWTNPELLRHRIIDVVARSDWQSPLLFAFAPCAFFIEPTRRRYVFLVTGVIVFYFLGWYLFTHHIDRFWLHLLPTVAVLAGTGAMLLWRKLSERVAVESGLPLLAALFTRITIPLVSAGLLVFNGVFITTPLCGPNEYLLSAAAARRTATTRSIQILQPQLPPGACVLFVGEAAVFDATFDCFYNTVFDRCLLEDFCVDVTAKTSSEPFPVRRVRDIQDRWQSLGITHLFVNWNEILRYREPGSYGYTDFVSPHRMQQLVDLGLLEPVSLPVDSRLRLWETVSPGQQQEILRWGPELRQSISGYDSVRQYDFYRVTPNRAAFAPQ